MSEKLVDVKEENNIAVVTINNPPVNILTKDVTAELQNVLTTLEANKEIRAIVLTGAGATFIAGADIKEIAAIKSQEQAKGLATRGQDFFLFIENMKKPVIAAINGHCLGGGLELVMSCHIRIASDRARFGQPEINLGIIPGFGGTQRLTKIVGPSVAGELILTGNMISANEATQIGLVGRVVPEGELLRQATGLAKTIAQKSGIAIAAAMTSIGAALSCGIKEGMDIEAEEFSKLCGSKDMREGVGAFIEKRQPKFNQN